MKNLTQLIIISATLLTANLATAKTATRYICHDEKNETTLSLNSIGMYFDSSGVFTVITPEKTFNGNINSSEITIKGSTYRGGTHTDFTHFTFNNNTGSFEMFLGGTLTNLQCEHFQIDVKTKTCFSYGCGRYGSTAKEYEVIEDYQCPQARPLPCKTGP